MSDSHPPDVELKPYELHFLTDQWEWEEELSASTLEQAKALARDALVNLVEDEKPKMACVKLVRGGAAIGVWDWVETQAYWSRL